MFTELLREAMPYYILLFAIIAPVVAYYAGTKHGKTSGYADGVLHAEDILIRAKHAVREAQELTDTII